MILSMFSQLALEAKFKESFFEGRPTIVHCLTKCICAGVRAEEDVIGNRSKLRVTVLIMHNWIDDGIAKLVLFPRRESHARHVVLPAPLRSSRPAEGLVDRLVFWRVPSVASACFGPPTASSAGAAAAGIKPGSHRWHASVACSRSETRSSSVACHV